jgi:esterase/lipase
MPNLLAKLYRATVNTILVQQTKFKEDLAGVKNPLCRSLLLIQPQPTGKVALLFHGFTAAPYQFGMIAQLLYAQGYSVMVPLMPGHGCSGDFSATNPTPLPTDAKPYKEFALDWFKQAQALDPSAKITLGGLSGGASLAAWLGIEKASLCDRAVLYAPYFGNSRFVLDLIINKSQNYRTWMSEPNPAYPGYNGFQTQALKVFLTIGEEVLKRSANEPTPPMFTISTGCDIAVNNNDHEEFFNNIVGRQPLSWYYCFDRDLNIPHTMLLKAEGNQWEAVLNVMTKAYLGSNVTWAEVEEIAYRMTDGKTYPQVIEELGLESKASPDLPAMITMVDKRAIVEARNPSRSMD